MPRRDDIESILESTPPTRQTVLFSATMPPVIRKIARQHLRDPEEVTIAAPLSEVWTAWTTEDAITSFIGVDAKIEARFIGPDPEMLRRLAAMTYDSLLVFSLLFVRQLVNLLKQWQQV